MVFFLVVKLIILKLIFIGFMLNGKFKMFNNHLSLNILLNFIFRQFDYAHLKRFN